MARASKTTSIQASPEAVWDTVRDFGGIHTYVDAIVDVTTEGTGVGARRTLTLQDGAQVVERLDHLDDEACEMGYSIVRSPLPLEDYTASVQVREEGADACEITWSSTFEPRGAPEGEAVELIEGIYAMAFEGLKNVHGAASSSA